MRLLGPSAQAFESLDSQQRIFLQSLPKAELHAHLNGCIPFDCLIALARDVPGDISGTEMVSAREGLRVLEAGAPLRKFQNLEDAFDLFLAIYHITSTPKAIALATSAVLDSFLESSPQGDPPQCSYIELRTTPRSSPHMSRKEYLSAVLDEVVKREDKAALIVSVDRRMTVEDAAECIDLAVHFRDSGQPVVAIDLCGLPFVCSLYFPVFSETLNELCPKAGDMKAFSGLMRKAQDAGLFLTTHIAEVRISVYEGVLLIPHIDGAKHFARYCRYTFMEPSTSGTRDVP